MKQLKFVLIDRVLVYQQQLQLEKILKQSRSHLKGNTKSYIN